jgi:hypothetical protein
LVIDEVELTDDFSDVQSIKVTDVWVYEDENLIGVYELPCNVPILETGEKTLSIAAGISIYDQGNIRESYPAYTWFDTTITFTEETETTILPRFTYRNVPLVAATFESDSNLIAVKRNGQLFPNNIRTSGAKYGTYMGEISIPANTTVKAYLKDSIAYNTSENIYFETDHQNNITAEIGIEVYANGDWTQKPILLSIQPNTEWNKIYFDPSPYLSAVASEGYFRIYMLVENDSDESSFIRIDNWNIVK